MENKINHVVLHMDARSVNESFSRMAVMAFMADMDPTLEQLEDVKTAVSEAVTNAIIHGYQDEKEQVELVLDRQDNKLVIQVIDKGVGIANIEEARKPFYTTKSHLERSGMGFSFMEAFMDELIVFSEPGKGTRVVMTKYIEGRSEQ